MKISYHWLSQFIDHGLQPEALGEALTGIGLEVEDVLPFSTVAPSLKGLIIGEVVEVLPHPNADRLRLTKVDVGYDSPLSIVCGAPNVAVGQKVVIAREGTQLYPYKGESFTIKKSKIRGEESNGMICAEDEIGLSSNHDGIMILNPDAKTGTSFRDYLQPYEDFVLEIGLTPNRVDAASHIGVARDLAALINQPVKYPDALKLPQNKGSSIDIHIEDAEGCPRYSGLVINNLKVKESPAWLQHTLKSIGLQPINNIVDVTNYVLHELGHPLHAFDVDKIKGKKIIIRKSMPGEKFITLDKKERTLSGSEMMICNEDSPMALAGVFGGLDSGISNETTSIFIESAWFNPSSIRQTARKHQLFTDASFRFERGVDPEGTFRAMLRAAKIITDVAGGQVEDAYYDVYPKPFTPVELEFKYHYLDKIAGYPIPHPEVKNILKALEFQITSSEDEHSLKIVVPTWKTDVLRPIDVAEEVLRIFSFDRIEFDHKLSTIIQKDEYRLKEQLKKKFSATLVAHGFYESYHLSFLNPKDNLLPESSVKVLNPISLDLEEIRDNMLIPGLKSLAYNLHRQQKDIQLFEWGNSYQKASNTYQQSELLSLWATGSQHQESWYSKAKNTDFYYLKGIIEQLFDNSLTNSEPSEIPGLVDAVAYQFQAQNLATIGRVSDHLLSVHDIRQQVYYAELDVNTLLLMANYQNIEYNPVSRYPRVDRDLALLVPLELNFGQIKDRIQTIGSEILKYLYIFDVYQGGQVPEGFKSYAVRLEFEDIKQTLEDKKVDKIIQKILQTLESEFGVTVRK